MSDWRRYWVGFNLVKGIGAVRLRALLDHFGDAALAWEATPGALREAGLGASLVERLVSLRADLDLNVVWDSIQRKGIQVITWRDDSYPLRLKELENPPPVLYVRGTLQAEDAWAVAVVGTRRASAYGRRVAEEVAGELGHHGVTVVSGLARGVDTLAHRAALQTGGRTLAVLGSGVDHIYPPENRRLAEAVVANGALLSDYAPGTAPEASNFPPRNRIIAGLARAVVVIEAGARSGALITANFAADQGKDVLAVPGNIYSPVSRGCNRLIAQGAHPLLSPQNVLEVLELTRVTEHRTARRALPGDAQEEKIYQLLSHEPAHIDEISVQAGLPVEEVSASLTMMELKGLVGKVGGMRYVRLREQGPVYMTSPYP